MDAVDAVITWVDGSDPAYRDKLYVYRNADPADRSRDDVGDHRWSCAGELRTCLLSIARYAPWIRSIWIVTDGQTPDLSCLPPAIAGRVAIVDHTVIFEGHCQYLPTFHSRGIETLLWRIPGLARNFLFLNDDFFLTNRIGPESFFRGGRPVLRGTWQALRPEDCDAYFAKSSHRCSQSNSLRLLDNPGHRFFSHAHIPVAFDRDMLQSLICSSWTMLEGNLKDRFRNREQFNIVTLYANHLLRQDMAIIQDRKDWCHISSDTCGEDHPLRILLKLAIAKATGKTLGCVNDVAAVNAKLAAFQHLLGLTIGVGRDRPARGARSR